MNIIAVGILLLPIAPNTVSDDIDRQVKCMLSQHCYLKYFFGTLYLRWLVVVHYAVVFRLAYYCYNVCVRERSVGSISFFIN